MAYRVLAGYVSAETKVESGGRAAIDIPRGAVLPDDVPAEQVERFLAHGHVEHHEVVEPAGEVEPGEGDGLDGLDKDALLALAKEQGVEVDSRWGVKRIAAAVKENGK